MDERSERQRPSGQLFLSVSLPGTITRVVGAILVPDVVERADVRVVQAGNGALWLEALPQLESIGETVGPDLDGHDAIEPCVPGTVNFAHPAFPERPPNPVGPGYFACYLLRLLKRIRPPFMLAWLYCDPRDSAKAWEPSGERVG
jgi:hypothetical protein